jgi:uncharacterized protein with von Willebrand factor type A (vWA) domain
MPQYFTYRNWDGTQQILPFDADAIMEAISEDLLGDGDLRRALRRLMQQGYQPRDQERMMGLRDLMERLRQRRQEMLKRNNLGGMLDEINKKLEEIVQTERQGIERRVDEGRQKVEQARQQQQGQQGEQGEQDQQGQQNQPDGEPDADQQAALQKMLENMAARRQQQLDALPDDPGGKIRELNEYDFLDPDARQQYQDLLASLQQQMMNQMFQGMKQSMQQMTPEKMAELREMVRDLNQMLRDKAEGRDPKFDEFKQKHGQFFPPNINSLEELMEYLQQQMAAMDSLMQSMSPGQRQELQDMMDAMLRDDRLKWELAQLAANMQELMPYDGQRYQFSGDEPVTLSEAMRMMDQLQQMEQLEQQLQNARFDDNVGDLNPEKVAELLGAEEGQAVRQLQDLAKMLEDAGYLEERGGKLELTPSGIRKIGQKALQDIFHLLKKDAFGKHATPLRGRGGERTDESKPYEFGDPFYLDLEATLRNAVSREGPGSPVRLHPEDFEVFHTELQTQSSTVLMLDMSRAMLLRGCFLAAKKVALALNHLIRTQFPRDALYIVGFSAYARELKPEALPQIDWSEYEYGTNLHHALMLARTLLARHKTQNKQIIVITDGEPTAHLEDGQSYFNYPPSYRTIQETLREVTRCTRDRIVINTFMLERTYDLTEFVNQMTAINRGRAFYATPEALGEYILVDYVSSKRKRIK